MDWVCTIWEVAAVELIAFLQIEILRNYSFLALSYSVLFFLNNQKNVSLFIKYCLKLLYVVVSLFLNNKEALITCFHGSYCLKGSENIYLLCYVFFSPFVYYLKHMHLTTFKNILHDKLMKNHRHSVVRS